MHDGHPLDISTDRRLRRRRVSDRDGFVALGFVAAHWVIVATARQEA